MEVTTGWLIDERQRAEAANAMWVESVGAGAGWVEEFQLAGAV